MGLVTGGTSGKRKICIDLEIWSGAQTSVSKVAVMALCDHLQPGMLKESMRASSFSSNREEHSSGPACSCIYAWSALLLVPSAHFIIHAYSTVATGNATLSACTTLHFINTSAGWSYTPVTPKFHNLPPNGNTAPGQCPEPSSVSSHCGFGKLNFHRANELVTRSGLELHQLDHDEALHARDRESLCRA